VLGDTSDEVFKYILLMEEISDWFRRKDLWRMAYATSSQETDSDVHLISNDRFPPRRPGFKPGWARGIL
jgi:hypothetical protein